MSSQPTSTDDGAANIAPASEADDADTIDADTANTAAERAGNSVEGATTDDVASDTDAIQDEVADGDDDIDEDDDADDGDVADEADDSLPAGALEAALAASTAEEVEETGDTEKHWYILKVQSNRENTICDALRRRAKIADVEQYFGEIIVPTEMVTEFKGGKKRVVKRKLYPGYIIVNMQITDESWFLVRETPGIGDFTGSAGRPVPMDDAEIARFLNKQEEDTSETPKLKIAFSIGDRVKINDGTFENFEGAVESIDEANGRVTVMTNIFGRSTPVELEYWQIEVL
ncbi:MAG: transcription termination/antitermination factor NusG [Planctomycetales bacterium]|nr:transcription termination/antitermination factor NusG [Planctomycetales bacterium]